jgi:ankyrin repeat protein
MGDKEKALRSSVYYDGIVRQLLLSSLGGNLEEIKLYLDVGCSVDARESDGMTALMIASAMGNTKIVKYLLKMNANVNIENGPGRTALTFAIEGGHQKIKKLLLENGARFLLKGTTYQEELGEIK